MVLLRPECGEVHSTGRCGRPGIRSPGGNLCLASLGNVPDRRLLDSTELFAALPSEVLDPLRERAVVRPLEKGALLFGQGDASHELFVVSEGRIAVSTRANDGRESMVAILESGGLFGELGLFDDEPRSAEARALTDSEVIAVRYDDVRAALRERPEMLWIIVR